MKNHFILSTLFVLCLNFTAFAQLDTVYYNFTSGIVNSGVIQTTDNFTAEPIPLGEPKVIPLLPGTNTEIIITPQNEPKGLPPYKYIEDINATQNPQGSNGQTVLLQKFPGIPMSQYIPPDPTMAVGPNHVIVCANSLFRIYDKHGNLLKNISASSWWGPLSPYEAGDPQVIYDHFMERWVFLWMEGNDNPPQYGDLIAYSDNSDPLGVWYLYRFPNTSLGDYPKLGFDDEALYIMTRRGATSIRIINKTELYSSNGGPVNFSRIYNIRKPGGPSQPLLDCITPAITYTQGDGAWFLWAQGSINGSLVQSDFYALYKITNPLTNPGMRGKVLNVQLYRTPPDGGQLGGGLGLETSGWMSRAPVVRDGYLYAAHDVANSTNLAYSCVKYLKIDLSTPSIVENIEYGNVGYYYMYPACTVDKDHNVAITFSRSGTTEYVGGYFATKLATDSLINPSVPLAEGQGNYVVEYGSGRNRWGDYLGIYLDPVDENNVWIFPEYVPATDTWGTIVGEIRMAPYQGAHAFAESFDVDFGNLELGSSPITKTVTFTNYGTDDLVINTVDSPIGPFTFLTNYPITLAPYDSIDLEFQFDPTDAFVYNDLMSFTNNDPEFPGFTMKGRGYEMNETVRNVFYAVSNAAAPDTGKSLLLNKNTGAGEELGGSNFSDIRALTVDPATNIMYGIVPGGSSSDLVRVNATEGDAYTLYSLDNPFMVGLAFDTAGVLYGALQNGGIYEIDLSNGTDSLVVPTTFQLTSIAFDPLTNELWATPRLIVGQKDKIFKIDLITGDTTNVGRTGFNVQTNDLAFDEDGMLYGVIGGATEVGKLISIDRITAAGTELGETGFMNVQALGYSIKGEPTSVKEEGNVPKEFALKQNYPNPFNPTTNIEFSLPIASDVQLIVYNILGQQVASLINDQKPAGNYSIVWNADDSKGIKLSSGIYLYKLKASGADGKEFQEIMKMVLLK